MQKKSKVWQEINHENPIFNVTWIIDAPWAHPIWSQYVLYLYDLTSKAPDRPEVILYAKGVTHEFILAVVDPATVLEEGIPLKDQKFTWLTPPNYIFQFAAENDMEATTRMQDVVDRIEKGHLSPDTDFRPQWRVLFKDAVSLLKGEEENARKEHGPLH